MIRSDDIITWLHWLQVLKRKKRKKRKESSLLLIWHAPFCPPMDGWMDVEASFAFYSRVCVCVCKATESFIISANARSITRPCVECTTYQLFSVIRPSFSLLSSTPPASFSTPTETRPGPARLSFNYRCVYATCTCESSPALIHHPMPSIKESFIKSKGRASLS